MVKLIKRILPLVLVLVITIPAVISIIRPGFFAMHDDLQVMRQLQMDKCFRDLQIPCRWVSDMGYGFGYPLFNYYPPFPYYLGELIHLIGFSFLDTVKILFILSFLFSALSIYVFAKEFWGRLGAVVSAAFYVWAPYHATDIYVRGAMNEAWAMVFFPIILLSIYKIIKTNNWHYVPVLAISSALLILSHIPTLVVFVPGAITWAIFWLYNQKTPKALSKLFVAGIFSVTLSAFFLFPVIFELKFVHSETLFIGYFNYLAHFLNLNQLFISRYWGYGESVNGPADTMAFSLGHFHWVLSLTSLIAAFKIRKTKQIFFLTILFFFAWTYFYTFLTHQRAAFVWRYIPILANLQFPWRILALSMIGTSFLAGSVILLFKKLNQKFQWMIVLIIITALISFNFKFFTWREFYPDLTDQKKFSGDLWNMQKTSGIFDYLPKQLPLPPKDSPNGDAQFLEGEGTYIKELKKSNLQTYSVEVASNKAQFQINTFYFPGWKVFVDNKLVEIDPYRDKEYGIMIVDLQKGIHQINAVFGKTPIRAISDIISAVSWIVLIISAFLVFKRKSNLNTNR